MEKNKFYTLTTAFAISSLSLVFVCYLLRGGTFPKINTLVWGCTVVSFVLFAFYLMNGIVYFVKKKLGIPYTKTIEVQKPIKKSKKKKVSYKKVFVNILPYSMIPSCFLIALSLVLMLLTYESGERNEKMVLFYFVNTPMFVVSVFTLLVALASNFQLKWLKNAYIVAAFLLATLCFVGTVAFQK